jgi:hypothetical protein
MKWEKKVNRLSKRIYKGAMFRRRIKRVEEKGKRGQGRGGKGRRRKRGSKREGLASVSKFLKTSLETGVKRGQGVHPQSLLGVDATVQ